MPLGLNLPARSGPDSPAQLDGEDDERESGDEHREKLGRSIAAGRHEHRAVQDGPRDRRASGQAQSRFNAPQEGRPAALHDDGDEQGNIEQEEPEQPRRLALAKRIGIGKRLVSRGCRSAAPKDIQHPTGIEEHEQPAQDADESHHQCRAAPVNAIARPRLPLRGLRPAAGPRRQAETHDQHAGPPH